MDQLARINILCIADYFVPGYLGGGPITTLVNMRKQLAGKAVLSIFTRNHDFGQPLPYPGIESNKWTYSPDGPIYYSSPSEFGPRGILTALSNSRFDVLYFNSFFSLHASILPLIALKGQKKRPRILMAPRGEFSAGALAIKKTKKSAFLALSRLSALHNDVFWHASTAMEANDIVRVFPRASGRVFVAANPVFVDHSVNDYISSGKDSGRLRIAFISRISPKKNLDGLIRILTRISSPVCLDIYGPIEDQSYWHLCSSAIAALPKNIIVSNCGALEPELVTSTFAKYDLFAFPTHGENFGHAIFESLRAGTPVLVSDQTPWQQDKAGALSVIPLDDMIGWQSAIEDAIKRNGEEQARIRRAARDYAVNYVQNSADQKANSDLFFNVLNFC